MSTEQPPAMQLEQHKLTATLNTIDQQYAHLKAIPAYFGIDLTEQALDLKREQTLQKLTVAGKEPYFGRIDFQEDGSAATAPLYLGKLGLQDTDSIAPLVIDWRAPVASLFYTFTGGDDLAAYESPDGTINGTVHLKRNLVVRQRELQRMVDTYERGSDRVSAADEFLLYRLGENKDNKLRDIVSTIQAEQDQIIRAPRSSALIIQGAAGSGKTTVALHRLAYLLYQYQDSIRAERMIIFAPSRMFLDYISGVLPELGVGDIQQMTFVDWALERLDSGIKLADPAASLEQWFAVGSKRPVISADVPGRYKGSVQFKQQLGRALQQYEAQFVPRATFEAWLGATIPQSMIDEWFFTEYRHDPMYKRRDRVIARMERWMAMELNKVLDPNRKKELKKTGSARLKAYAKKWLAPSPYELYNDLFRDTSQYWHPQAIVLPDTIDRKRSLQRFKQKEVLPEDLPPLVYIHDYVYGIASGHSFDHVVIDEAQDISPFQVAILQAYNRSGSFTILGDLSQGIHAYQGVWSWDELSSLFQQEHFAYYQLTRSYRSTTEIIRYANDVLLRGYTPVALAEPVFRSGDPVEQIDTSAYPNHACLIAAVTDLLATGTSQTIALIGRTANDCSAIHLALQQANIPASLIEAGQEGYLGGVSVLPAYLSKGLEFDSVFIVDVDHSRYDLNETDAKLLYVACTRALHRLYLTYSGQISPLIASANK